MLLYRDKHIEGSFVYFQAKYPILKGTQLLLTQESQEGSIKRLGSYEPTEDKIILLDDPRTDLYFNQILTHEIAHAINYKQNKEFGHTPNWKSICNDIFVTSGVLPWPHTIRDADWFTGGYVPLLPNLNKFVKPIDILPEDDDTLIYIKRHKNRVLYWMTNFALHLLTRAAEHDNSKLKEPELGMWRKMDEEPRYPYSTDPESDYQKKLRRYQPVFIEHWKNNRHHPEYFDKNRDDCIDHFGFDLLDLIEFICDQMLGYRTSLGYTQAKTALATAQERYKFDKEVYQLLENTVRNYFATIGGDANYHTLYEKHSELTYENLPMLFDYHIDIFA